MRSQRKSTPKLLAQVQENWKPWAICVACFATGFSIGVYYESNVSNVKQNETFTRYYEKYESERLRAEGFHREIIEKELSEIKEKKQLITQQNLQNGNK